MIKEIESRLNHFATLPDGWDLHGVHFKTEVIAAARRLSRRAERYGFTNQEVHAEHQGAVLLCIWPTRDSQFQVGIEADGTFELVLNDCHEMGLPSVEQGGFTFEQIAERLRWMSDAVRAQGPPNIVLTSFNVEAFV